MVAAVVFEAAVDSSLSNIHHQSDFVLLRGFHFSSYADRLSIIIYYLLYLISGPSSSLLGQDLRSEVRLIGRGVTLRVTARGTDFCCL